MKKPFEVSFVLAQLEDAISVAGSATAFAKDAGVGVAHVCDVRALRRPPGPKVLAALGFTKVSMLTTTLYQRVSP